MSNQPTFISKYSAGQGIVKTGSPMPLTTADSLVLLYKSPTSSNGSLIQYINLQALGTNDACILRLFLNNGQDKFILSNNTLINEIVLPATVSNDTLAIENKFIELGIKIPAGYELLGNVSITVASGYSLVTFGGEF